MFESLLEQKKEYFGLDIGYNTLKIVQLEKSGHDFRLVAYNETITPPNALLDKNPVIRKSLSETIRKSMESAKPHKISAKAICSALPESMVFTKIIKLPVLKEKELANAVPFEAAEFFPMPLAEMNVDWQVLDSNGNGNKNVAKNAPKTENEILVVGTPKKVVKDFTDLLDLAKLELIALETKPIAAARAIMLPEEKDVYILVDFGSETSSVCIVDNLMVKTTGTSNTGGNVITRNLAQELKIDIQDAEKIKKTSDEKSPYEAAKKVIIEKSIDLLVEEIKTSIKYYQTRLESGSVIKGIKLYGGSARLPNLSEYIQKQLNIPTVLANPWSRIKTRPAYAVPVSESLKYTTAIGLAMRDL